MFTLKCFRATEKWKQRDVEAVFAKLCEHIFDILYSSYRYQLTHVESWLPGK